MRNYILPTTLFIVLLVISACGGFRYLDAPPLEFQDIDYGFETHFYEGDLRIAYVDEGTGDQTLLLVHGLASNAGFWRYAIAELQSDARVIAIDLPGFGKSSKGNYPYGMTWYADQIAKFVEAMELENVIYVGHSMGGQIGSTLAINHPEVIRKLVLVAPAGFEGFQRGAGDWLRNAFTMQGIINNNEHQIRENLALNFHRWSEDWEWMVEERVRMAKGKEMPEFAYSVVQCVGAMLDEPTTDLLHKIPHETLIVYGKYDRLIPNMFLNPGRPSDVFEFGHAQIRNSILVEIDNAGHMLQIEKPIELSEAIRKFLK